MSEPYAPLAPAPAGFTLDRALAATVDPAGTYHVGKLSFADRQSYNDFKAAQTDLGGTPVQLATLHALETTGVAPRSEPMQPAPPGTTAAQLLDVTGKTPNAAGFYELGTLRVQKDEYPAFAALQTGLVARNPEALAALYHMEHAPDQPVTFRVTGDDDRNDRFQPGDANQPGGNTISWNPHTMIRDAFNGARVAPDTAALHEETHWAARDVGDTLASIPAGAWDNHEEERVIEGSEARDMKLLGREPRHSHFGYALPTDRIDSITPSLTVTQNGTSREMHAPYQQQGRVIGVSGDTTTIAIRGDGSQPDHRIDLETEQLSLAMNGIDNAKALLSDARQHGDVISIQLTNDGKMIYTDVAQQTRLQAQPDPNLHYPEPMHDVARPAVAVPHGLPQPIEVGR